MAQQLNLLDRSTRPRRDHFSARRGASGIGLLAALSLVAAAGLHWDASRTQHQAQAVEAGTSTDAADASTQRLATLGTERDRLRDREANLARIRSARDAYAVEGAGGYSEFFRALARQSDGALWITGLAVSADSRSIELRGRMLDGAVLPDYLRRLNGEHRFKGRPFAQLQIRTAAPLPGELGSPFTEFALISQPGASNAGASR